MKYASLLALAIHVTPTLTAPAPAHAQTAVDVLEVSQPKPEAGDFFGRSVSLEGGLLFVGSPGDVGGGAGSGGSVWVFQETSSGDYEPVTRLDPPAPDKMEGVKFGWSLDVEGSRAVIGAPGASHNGATSGRAYIFEAVGSQWTLVAELDEPARAIGDGFGEAVALSGDRILVAAPRRDGVALDTGRVYAFDRDAQGAWTVSGSFTASDATASALFGIDVDLEGDRALVAASPYGNLGNKHRAYIFERTVSGGWGEVQELLGSDTTVTSIFGPPSLVVGSCALAGDLAAVGCPLSAIPFIGSSSGRVSIFRRQIAGQWLLETIADPQGMQAGTLFGASVALEAGLLIVGAPGVADDADASGAVYIYQPSGVTSWTERSKVTLAKGVKYAAFGTAVDVEGDRFAGGALGITTFAVADEHSPAVVGRIAPVADAVELQKLPVIDVVGPKPWLGYSVAAAGSLAIAGSPTNSSNTTGAIQILRRNLDGGWTVEHSQTISGGAPARAVATDGHRCLVSVYLGFPERVHVFEEGTLGQWGIAATLQPTGQVNIHGFGASVDIDGDRAVAGSPDEVRGNGSTGRTWVFERDAGDVWNAVAVVQPSGAVPGEMFGAAVAIDGDLLAIGAPATGVQQSGGAVFIFERTTLGSWGQVAALQPFGWRPTDQFGAALDMHDGRLVVGAVGDDQRGTDAGSAFVFERDVTGTWVQRARLLASDGSNQDAFGHSVALDGEQILIGAPNTEGANGRTGAAYLFERLADGSWYEVVKFTGSETAQSDRFGSGVALAAGSALVGAPEADSAVVDGGAVFTFEIDHLYRSVKSLSIAGGGTQLLHVRAGEPFAGQLFLMLGSASGTSPGFDVPGSSVTLPLAHDAYFDLLVDSGGARLLVPWIGLLDEHGSAQGSFRLPAGIDAGFIGTVLNHAALFIDLDTFEFSGVTGAVALSLEP